MAAPAEAVNAAAAVVGTPVGFGDWIVVLPVAISIAGAASCLVLHGLVRWQVRITATTLLLMLIAAVLLFVRVLDAGVVTMAMGDWMPPFGIVFTVDTVGAVLVLTTAVVGLLGFAFALGDVGEGAVRYGFGTFYCLLMAGVAGAFSTGDLFNLYVWYEVFLLASFGLLILGGERPQLDAGVKYAVLSLIGTTVFLVAVGLVYGLTGALNMADVRTAMANVPQNGPASVIAALFVLGFAMKAAAFPVHFWLPASYHTPRAIVSGLFGGLLTKVGIYSLFRIFYTILPLATAPYAEIVLWVGAATAIGGVLGALAQAQMRRLASFLVISGIGIILIGIGLESEQALTGAIFYTVHSMLATTALFLTIGVVERLRGVGSLDGAGAVYRAEPFLAALFLVFGLSIAGLPPFSGVWPKIVLVEAAFARSAYGIVAVIVLTGFLSTIAIGRVWALVFLREIATTSGETESGSGGDRVPGLCDSRIVDGRWTWIVSLSALAAVVVLIGLFPEGLMRISDRAALGLLDASGYVRAVLGPPA